MTVTVTLSQWSAPDPLPSTGERRSMSHDRSKDGPVDGPDRRGLRGVHHRRPGTAVPPAALPARPRWPPRHALSPEEAERGPREGTAGLRDLRVDHRRAVLALLRAPRTVRERQDRPARGRVAQLLEACGHEQSHRDLA